MGQDGRWERTQAKRGLPGGLLRELAPSSANSSWTSGQGGMQTLRPGSSKCGASTQRWDPLGLSPFPVLGKMKLRVQCSVPGNVHEGKKKVCLYFRNPTLRSDGKFIHTVDVIKNNFFFLMESHWIDELHFRVGPMTGCRWPIQNKINRIFVDLLSHIYLFWAFRSLFFFLSYWPFGCFYGFQFCGFCGFLKSSCLLCVLIKERNKGHGVRWRTWRTWERGKRDQNILFEKNFN